MSTEKIYPPLILDSRFIGYSEPGTRFVGEYLSYDSKVPTIVVALEKPNLTNTGVSWNIELTSRQLNLFTDRNYFRIDIGINLDQDGNILGLDPERKIHATSRQKYIKATDAINELIYDIDPQNPSMAILTSKKSTFDRANQRNLFQYPIPDSLTAKGAHKKIHWLQTVERLLMGAYRNTEGGWVEVTAAQIFANPLVQA